MFKARSRPITPKRVRYLDPARPCREYNPAAADDACSCSSSPTTVSTHHLYLSVLSPSTDESVLDRGTTTKPLQNSQYMTSNNISRFLKQPTAPAHLFARPGSRRDPRSTIDIDDDPLLPVSTHPAELHGVGLSAGVDLVPCFVMASLA